MEFAEFRDSFMSALQSAHTGNTVRMTTEFDGYNDVGRVEFSEGTALQVYFEVLKRTYYFYFVTPRRILISGGTLANSVIQCIFEKDHLLIDSFYYVHDTFAKSHMKSVDFKGYGPRGMLLVKYIAIALGVDYVTVCDYWDLNGMDSTGLKAMLASKKTEPVAQKAAFFEEKGTYAGAQKHGYYGGFGFKPSGRMLKADVKDIQCSCRIR